MSMMAMKVTGLVLVLAMFGAGCVAPVEGPTSGGRQAGSVDPPANGSGSPVAADGKATTGGQIPGGAVDANTRYIAEQDTTKAQEIVSRMWGILTAAPCWYMQNSTNNYSFSGVNDYRYAGYETTSGQVGLNSVGTFGGYDAADVVISQTQYWIGIADAQTIGISFIHDNGKVVTNWFHAAAPGQYCV
jgi:hypothetical protein